jgi:hypothetical protein
MQARQELPVALLAIISICPFPILVFFVAFEIDHIKRLTIEKTLIKNLPLSLFLKERDESSL